MAMRSQNLGDLGLSVSDVSEWFSQATDFRGKYAEWQKQVSALRSSSIDAAKYPALAKQRADLLAQADSINAKIQSVVGGIESVYNTVKGYLSTAGQYVSTAASSVSSGAQSLIDWGKSIFGMQGLNGLGSLGILPVLIPVAVIASAAAAMVYWMKDNADLQQRVAEQKRLEATGMAPAAAAAVVEKTFGKAGSGLFANLGTIAKYSAIAAMAFIGWKIYSGMRK